MGCSRRGVYRTAALIGLLLFATGPVSAEGGGGFAQPAFSADARAVQTGTGTMFSAPGANSAYGWAAETVDVHGAGFSFSGTVGAVARGSSFPDGASSTGASGGYGAATAGGNPVGVTSENAVASFSKGQFSITGSEATLYVTVTVNGRTYLVAKEVAAALSRATQFGNASSSYAGASGPEWGGYSTVQVATTKAGGH